MPLHQSNRFTGFALVFLLIMLLGGSVFGQDQDPYNATLSDFEGEVFIQKTGEEDWLPVEKGMPLEEQDRLRTGADGYAEILYDDGSVVKMEENSQITLDEVSADYGSKKISSRISLWVGRLLLNIAKFTNTQSRFSVKTPTVVAGVRGTEFVTETITQEQSDVGVIDGEVSVESLNEEGEADADSKVILRPGFQTSGMKFRKPLVPTPLKERMVLHSKKIELLRKRALNNRRELPKIIKNRPKNREIIIKKWKKLRDEGKLPRTPGKLKEGNKNPTLLRSPKDPNQLQKPPLQRFPQKPGLNQPGGNMRKLPPPNLNKLPSQNPGNSQPRILKPGVPPPNNGRPPAPGSGYPQTFNNTPTSPTIRPPTQAPVESPVTPKPGGSPSPVRLPPLPLKQPLIEK